MVRKAGIRVRFQAFGSVPPIQVQLVDMDNETIAALTFFLSQVPSCRLEVVTSVEQSVDIASKIKADIILYGHEPESDGFNLIQELRTRLPESYVIVLLPAFDPDLVHSYTSAGARDFISKDHKFISSLRRGVRRAMLHVVGQGSPVEDTSFLPGFLGSPQVGDTILHYRIEEELGEGGISETYLVHDLNAGHPAVIKILNSHLWTGGRDRQRVIRQIKEATKVHHPDLVSIRSVEEAGDRTIIVMEYAEGESLKSMMQKGPLGMKRVLDIGIQISGTLSAVHDAGLAHGNIRPSSIIVSPYGRARLADFGFVRQLPDLTGLKINRRFMEKLWRAGILRETASYMSPEQLAGKEVDPRSDIFSLGCVLYHAITGVSPFDGISVPLVVHHVLRVSPPPPTDLISHLPEELDQLLALTLAKEREERIRSSEELSKALQMLADRKAESSGEVIRARLNALTENILIEQQRKSKERRIRDFVLITLSVLLIALVTVLYFYAFYDDGTRSIAVLPLQTNPPGPLQDAKAVEITENLIDMLSGVPDLRVIQNESVFQLAGRETSMSDIATLLNVRNIMSGRLVRLKSGWMIETRLYGATGKLSGENYSKTTPETTLSSLPRIGSFLLSKMELKNPPGAIPTAKWNNSEQRQIFWTGRSRYYRKTSNDVEQSIEFYEEAIALDSKNPAVYAAMAESLLWMATHSEDSSYWYSQAIEAARMALDFDPQSFRARAVLGAAYLMDDLDLKRAEKELRASLKVDPSHAPAISYLAIVLTATGREKEALVEIRTANALDPISQDIQNRSAWLLVQLRRYDDAILQSQRCMEIGSDSVFVHNVMGDAYLGKGLNEAAQAAYRQTQDFNSPDSAAKIATVMASSRMQSEAKKLLQNMEAEPVDHLTPEFMAAAYARLGMKDQAFLWLERALAKRTPGVLMMKVSFQFDSLRSDSRLDTLMRKAGLD